MAKAKYSYNEKRKEWITYVYDGTLTPSGQKRRKFISSKKSSADLEKKVLAFKQSLAEGDVQTRVITFGEYAKRWLEVSKAAKELNTRKMYQYTLSHFVGINHKPISSVTRSDFQQIINENLDHPRTCKTIKLTFTQIINSAVLDSYISESASKKILSSISLPKYQKPLKKPLSESERYAMMNADLDERKRAFISILYYCGLRRGEALALTSDDFDWDKQTVSVSKVIIFDSNKPVLKPYPKSDRGTRFIPLPDASVKHIKPYIESCTDRFLFHADNNEMMTAIGYRRMWESIICSMNIALGYEPLNRDSVKPITKLTAHTFRHNYCTELCYQIPTISTKEIARLLGDNEKMVIDVYSHLVEGKENTSEAINNVFN
jgi:integrase